MDTLMNGNNDFQHELKRVEDILGGANDFCTTYLCCLLKEKSFQNLLEELYAENENTDKESIYVEALRLGYRLSDIQACLDILRYETYDNILLPQVNVEEKIQEKQEECGEQNIYDVEPYYFSLRYSSQENIGDRSISYIEFESNLFSNKLFQNVLIERFKDVEIKDNDLIVLAVGEQINYLDVLGLEQLNLTSFEKVKEINKLRIETNNDGLEDVYYYLRHYIVSLENRTEIENIFIKIRKSIIYLNGRAKKIKISKFIDDKVLLEKLNGEGYYILEDFLRDSPNSITKEETNTLFNVINSFDNTLLPNILYNILDTLAPREIAVVRGRYLGDSILQLESIGKKYGCTRERIRQIEQKAAKKLAHPSRKRAELQMMEVLRHYCEKDSFATSEELLALFDVNTFGVFADKMLNLMSWSETFQVGFFNEGVEKELILELEALPTEFTFADLDDFAGYISETIDELSKDEVKFLILRRYNSCGDFIVKGKIKLRAVMSFLMKTYFPDGIDIYVEDNILLLREKAREHFDGFELAENDRAVRARLQDFCVPVGRGIWKWDSDECLVNDGLKKDIIDYIESYNAPILPIQAVLDRFKADLLVVEIDNKYHLQGQIKKFLPKGYSINRDYIFKGDTDSFYTVVEAFVKEANTIVTKNDIIKQFPGITDIVIQQATLYTKVLNMNGYYVHLDNLNITDEEMIEFKSSVTECIKDNNIYHAKNIFSSVKIRNSGLFSRVGIMHYLQFYYLLKELFPNDYSYNRPFIAQLGVNVISGEAQVLDRISEKKEVTIAELREITKEIGTIIDRYIEFVDRNSDSIIFKNHSTIISIDSAGISDASFVRIDEILTDFIKDAEYISLAQFFDYWKLPSIKWAWNEWSLYSIINKYSQKYKTAVSSNYLHEAIPILVKMEYDVNKIDYSEIESQEMEEEQEDLLDVLDYDDLE